MAAAATLGQVWLAAAANPTHFQKPNPKAIALPLSANSNCNSYFLKPKPLLPITSKLSTFKTAVAALDSDNVSSSDAGEKEQGPKRYYFVVANAKFMLDEEEHFQEVLFERLRLFSERNKDQDFWLVIEPKFLDKFPEISKRLKRPAVALVSTNGPWITFMKLRLDRVLAESFEAGSLEEALASNPTNLEFEKPEKWVAPYPKYESGWWEALLPPGSKVEAKV
ncbi:hypothetical protein UlMin_012902 [Ulmus minor]